MAQYLLSVHTVEGQTREPRTDDQTREFMLRVGELEAEMKASDVLVYSGRLTEPDAARVVRVEGGETLTTDGPFAEAKEQLGGFYIIDSADLDEALSWASKTSDCVEAPIEVRPFFDMRRG